MIASTPRKALGAALNWLNVHRIAGTLLVAVLVVLVVGVFVRLRYVRLAPDQIVDQFGTYALPDGNQAYHVSRTADGHVRVRQLVRQTRFYFLPTTIEFLCAEFESERRWLLCFDRYDRLWLFVGKWEPQWGERSKLPSGGWWVNYQQVIVCDRFGIEVVSSTGNWAGVPTAFFDCLPGKQEPVWGGVSPPVPHSPPPLSATEERRLGRFVSAHRSQDRTGPSPFIGCSMQSRARSVRTIDLKMSPIHPATSAFISRTACSKPTMIARATMLWPMFSSLTPSIAATGPTLR